MPVPFFHQCQTCQDLYLPPEKNIPMSTPHLAYLVEQKRLVGSIREENQKSKKLILAMEPNGKSSLNRHQLKLGPKRTTIYLDLNPY